MTGNEITTTKILSPYEELVVKFDDLQRRHDLLQEEYRNLQCDYSFVKFGGVSK